MEMLHSFIKPIKYILILICGFVLNTDAQDIHFSQLHSSPLHLNPALTGVFDGQMRLQASYRNQWKLPGANFKTYAAAMDIKAFEVADNGTFGLGVSVFGDQGGDLDFGTRSGSLSISFLQLVGRNRGHFLSTGFQIGMVENSIDLSKARAFDSEPLATLDSDQLVYIDVAAGVLWYYTFDNDNFMFLGSSLFHVNNPKVAFAPSFSDAIHVNLYKRFVVHGGGLYKIDSDLHLIPSFFFFKQGPNQEINTGSFLKYQRKERRFTSDLSYYGGLWLRWFADLDRYTGVDAIVATLRLDVSNISFSFSYDFNISSLARVSRGAGGPEISFIYYTKMGDQDRLILCPFY